MNRPRAGRLARHRTNVERAALGVSERRSAAILALTLETLETPEIDAGWLTPRKRSVTEWRNVIGQPPPIT
jgi:hypothetical protein